jgi:DNA-binding YbaB/EbfC family protein
VASERTRWRTTLTLSAGSNRPTQPEVLAPRGFYYEYLARRDHVAEIEDLAGRFFKRALGVSVKQREAVAAGTASEAAKNPKPNEAELERAALGNPVVKAAMEILGGEVHTVRSRNRSGMTWSGGLGNIVKQAQELQERLAKVQAEAATKTVEATAGGGMVSVKVNGKLEVVSLRIEPQVFDAHDLEMLQDLVVAAVNQGIRAAQQLMAEEMSKRPVD